MTLRPHCRSLRFASPLTWLALSALTPSCADDSPSSHGENENGGSSAASGHAGTSGASASGGKSSSGGTSASGGKGTTGGADSSGGANSRGGNESSGGEAGSSGGGGSGGASASGGRGGAGGASGSGGRGGAGGASGNNGGTGGAATPGHGAYFPGGAFYYDDLSGRIPVTNSAAITRHMEQALPPNGWGGFGATRGHLRIDFSIVIVEAPASTMKYASKPADGYFYEGECDTAPIPLPAGGAVEANWESPPDLTQALSGYDCVGFDDGADCHLLVHAPAEQRLYEVYHATRRKNGEFLSGCLAIWDTSKVPSKTGRGLRCSSADAAGYAVAPLLATADEIAQGEISHALRLILPNDLIRATNFYPPATHGTNTTGSADTVPYGGRMRLRADYPLASLPPAARVVARALQRYGMLLADGGQIALTMASDLLTTHKWSEVGLEADSLDALKASDFEVLVEGDPVSERGADCPHEVITR